jgi:hypothetical protein
MLRVIGDPKDPRWQRVNEICRMIDLDYGLVEILKGVLKPKKDWDTRFIYLYCRYLGETHEGANQLRSEYLGMIVDDKFVPSSTTVANEVGEIPLDSPRLIPVLLILALDHLLSYRGFFWSWEFEEITDARVTTHFSYFDENDDEKVISITIGPTVDDCSDYAAYVKVIDRKTNQVLSEYAGSIEKTLSFILEIAEGEKSCTGEHTEGKEGSRRRLNALMPRGRPDVLPNNRDAEVNKDDQTADH